jgi:hypothetical protein
MYRGYFELPEDLKELLKIKDILKRRHEVNNRLTDKLIKAYAAQVSFSSYPLTLLHICHTAT